MRKPAVRVYRRTTTEKDRPCGKRRADGVPFGRRGAPRISALRRLSDDRLRSDLCDGDNSRLGRDLHVLDWLTLCVNVLNAGLDGDLHVLNGLSRRRGREGRDRRLRGCGRGVLATLHLVFEATQGFADSGPGVGQLARANDDQHDYQDDD
jgi:hypothetical protein